MVGTTSTNRASKSKGNLIGQGSNNSNQTVENDYGIMPAKYRGYNALTLDEQIKEFGREFLKLESDA